MAGVESKLSDVWAFPKETSGDTDMSTMYCPKNVPRSWNKFRLLLCYRQRKTRLFQIESKRVTIHKESKDSSRVC